ncbi:RPOL4c domain-containing protein, partial [Haematococcus lacustris]
MAQQHPAVVIDTIPVEEQGNIDQAAYKESYALTNSELNMVLDQYIQQKQQRVGPSYQPAPVVKKTKEYVARFANCQNKEMLRAMRLMLQNHNVKAYEAAILGNLMPDSADEAFAVLPSLKREPDIGLRKPMIS